MPSGYASKPTLHNTPEKFWARVEKTDSCWIWRGVVLAKGYGQLSVAMQKWSAHRYAYTITKGPIPDGLQLDHLCRNTRCVRPDHLEAVTALVNVRRSKASEWQTSKTHCPSGHAYTEDNIERPRGTNHRRCRACHRLRERERREQRNAA